MKTITYGFFIYICLTTTYGKSATNSSDTSNKCNVIEVINATNYFENCNLTSIGTKLEYDLQIDTVISYMCTGIFETAQRICELPKNLTISQKIFQTGMHNLKPLTQHPNTFCDAMQKVLANSSYNKAIDLSTHPNILELNKKLSSHSCRMFCWDSRVNSSRPKCNVLLWANTFLVHSVEQIDPGVKQQKPAAPVTNPSQIHEESTKKVKPALVNRTQSLPSNRTDTKQVENDLKNKPQIPKSSSSNVSAGNKITSIQPLKVEPKVPVAKTEESSVIKSAIDVQPESIHSSEDIGGNAEIARPPLPNESGKRPANQALGDKNGITDFADDNNEGIEEDGEDIPFAVGTEANLSKLDSNPMDETLEKSHHSGKGDAAGQVKATNQDNTVPHENVSTYPGPPDPPQHFFAYFMAVSFICLVCYIGYHKKHKIMAIIFEGRKSRGGRGRRRPNTAGYRKLDCNLEEAVTSQCNSNVTHVIY